MDYKSFYQINKEIARNATEFSKKFEKNHGIVTVVRGSEVNHYGINGKDILEKSITYYNNQPNCSATWCYVRDLKDCYEPIEGDYVPEAEYAQ